MKNVSSNPVVRNCNFYANMAIYGGAMGNNFSSPSITNCSFVGNSTGNPRGTVIFTFGGAIYSNFSSTTLTNCVFSNNHAFEGASIRTETGGSSLSLINCTFPQGGIYARGSVTAINCILDNASTFYSSININYSIIKNYTSGTGNLMWIHNL